jgi:hypothetical protein
VIAFDVISTANPVYADTKNLVKKGHEGQLSLVRVCWRAECLWVYIHVSLIYALLTAEQLS